jgi:uncharacterized protein
MIIPYQKLSREALKGMVEEFVTRYGTDNGYMGTDLERNAEMVMGQLKKGDAFVVYDEATLSANIVSKDHLGKMEPD